MEKYLVGGAVRDTLLKLPIKEKDWVVIGSNPQEMLKIGYQQVGKDFPVFLHPENHEEYALARTERKSGKGYTGFSCHTTPFITLEEDLYRRDLTINAMAYDIHGNLIDPYHGQRDIQLKVLRHVSHTFYEDPLRVLRVARFAARFAHMKFTIDPVTFTLMKKMIHELPLLSPERIWTETKKALITNSPQVYFQVLHRCGALKILFPEIDILFQIPVFPKWKLKKNIGYYTMMSLAKVACFTNDIAVRFAVLCQNLGQNIPYNQKNKCSQHHNHDISKISLIHELCNRLKIPHNINKLAKVVAEYHSYLHNSKLFSPEILMKLFNAFDCWRRPERIEQIIYIKKSEELDTINHTNHLHFQDFFLRTAFMITKTVKPDKIIQDGFTGFNIHKELYSRRLYALKIWQKNKKYNTLYYI